MKQKEIYYIGMDIHKKKVNYCIQTLDGTIVERGAIDRTRTSLNEFASRIKRPWKGVLEATLFIGNTVDVLIIVNLPS